MNFKKTVSSTLSAIVFSTNCAWAHLSETSLWSDRQKARSPEKVSSSPPQLAALPLSSFNSARLSDSLTGQIKKAPLAIQFSLTDIVKNVSASWGTFQSISAPVQSGHKTIIHIQDVHGNDEAQGNIGAAVGNLFDKKKADLLALEGDFGTMDLAEFRRFPDQRIIQDAANFLLKERKISGPIHTALTFPSGIPPVVGVDDARLHELNVNAYRISEPQTKELRAWTQQAQTALVHQKNRIFNPDLRRFHSLASAYHRDFSGAADFLIELDRFSPRPNGEAGRFLEALRLERALNFSRVEQERTALLSSLTPRLNPTRLSNLVNDSLAYRLGQISSGSFYRSLETLCEETGLSLADYPDMAKYLRYVLISDRINPEALDKEILEREEISYKKLLRSEAEKEILTELKRLALTEKLISFSLTPNEWNEYKKVRSAKHVVRRDEENSTYYAPRTTYLSHLDSFEDFYRYAEARDDAMAKNVLAAMEKNHAATAIVVTGGFHSKGLRDRFTQAGAVTLSFSPRLTKPEENADGSYLSLFTQEKISLDKIFEGQKLFLAGKPISNELLRCLAEALGLDRNKFPLPLLSAFFKHAGERRLSKAAKRPGAVDLTYTRPASPPLVVRVPLEEGQPAGLPSVERPGNAAYSIARLLNRAWLWTGRRGAEAMNRLSDDVAALQALSPERTAGVPDTPRNRLKAVVKELPQSLLIVFGDKFLVRWIARHRWASPSEIRVLVTAATALQRFSYLVLAVLGIFSLLILKKIFWSFAEQTFSVQTAFFTAALLIAFTGLVGVIVSSVLAAIQSVLHAFQSMTGLPLMVHRADMPFEKSVTVTKGSDKRTTLEANALQIVYTDIKPQTDRYLDEVMQAHIQMVLVRLVQNAARNAPKTAPGHISFRFEKKEDGIRLEVMDNREKPAPLLRFSNGIVIEGSAEPLGLADLFDHVDAEQDIHHFDFSIEQVNVAQDGILCTTRFVIEIPLATATPNTGADPLTDLKNKLREGEPSFKKALANILRELRKNPGSVPLNLLIAYLHLLPATSFSDDPDPFPLEVDGTVFEIRDAALTGIQQIALTAATEINKRSQQPDFFLTEDFLSAREALSRLKHFDEKTFSGHSIPIQFRKWAVWTDAYLDPADVGFPRYEQMNGTTLNLDGRVIQLRVEKGDVGTVNITVEGPSPTVRWFNLISRRMGNLLWGFSILFILATGASHLLTSVPPLMISLQIAVGLLVVCFAAYSAAKRVFPRKPLAVFSFSHAGLGDLLDNDEGTELNDRWLRDIQLNFKQIQTGPFDDKLFKAVIKEIDRIIPPDSTLTIHSAQTDFNAATDAGTLVSVHLPINMNCFAETAFDVSRTSDLIGDGGRRSVRLTKPATAAPIDATIAKAPAKTEADFFELTGILLSIVVTVLSDFQEEVVHALAFTFTWVGVVWGWTSFFGRYENGTWMRPQVRPMRTYKKLRTAFGLVLPFVLWTAFATFYIGLQIYFFYAGGGFSWGWREFLFIEFILAVYKTLNHLWSAGTPGSDLHTFQLYLKTGAFKQTAQTAGPRQKVLAKSPSAPLDETKERPSFFKSLLKRLSGLDRLALSLFNPLRRDLMLKLIEEGDDSSFLPSLVLQIQNGPLKKVESELREWPIEELAALHQEARQYGTEKNLTITEEYKWRYSAIVTLIDWTHLELSSEQRDRVVSLLLWNRRVEKSKDEAPLFRKTVYPEPEMAIANSPSESVHDLVMRASRSAEQPVAGRRSAGSLQIDSVPGGEGEKPRSVSRLRPSTPRQKGKARANGSFDDNDNAGNSTRRPGLAPRTSAGQKGDSAMASKNGSQPAPRRRSGRAVAEETGADTSGETSTQDDSQTQNGVPLSPRTENGISAESREPGATPGGNSIEGPAANEPNSSQNFSKTARRSSGQTLGLNAAGSQAPVALAIHALLNSADEQAAVQLRGLLKSLTSKESDGPGQTETDRNNEKNSFLLTAIAETLALLPIARFPIELGLAGRSASSIESASDKTGASNGKSLSNGSLQNINLSLLTRLLISGLGAAIPPERRETAVLALLTALSFLFTERGPSAGRPNFPPSSHAARQTKANRGLSGEKDSSTSSSLVSASGSNAAPDASLLFNPGDSSSRSSDESFPSGPASTVVSDKTNTTASSPQDNGVLPDNEINLTALPGQIRSLIEDVIALADVLNTGAPTPVKPSSLLLALALGRLARADMRDWNRQADLFDDGSQRASRDAQAAGATTGGIGISDNSAAARALSPSALIILAEAMFDELERRDAESTAASQTARLKSFVNDETLVLWMAERIARALRNEEEIEQQRRTVFFDAEDAPDESPRAPSPFAVETKRTPGQSEETTGDSPFPIEKDHRGEDVQSLSGGPWRLPFFPLLHDIGLLPSPSAKPAVAQLSTGQQTQTTELRSGSTLQPPANLSEIGETVIAALRTTSPVTVLALRLLEHLVFELTKPASASAARETATIRLLAGSAALNPATGVNGPAASIPLIEGLSRGSSDPDLEEEILPTTTEGDLVGRQALNRLNDLSDLMVSLVATAVNPSSETGQTIAAVLPRIQSLGLEQRLQLNGLVGLTNKELKILRVLFEIKLQRAGLKGRLTLADANRLVVWMGSQSALARRVHYQVGNKEPVLAVQGGAYLPIEIVEIQTLLQFTRRAPVHVILHAADQQAVDDFKAQLKEALQDSVLLSRVRIIPANSPVITPADEDGNRFLDVGALRVALNAGLPNHSNTVIALPDGVIPMQIAIEDQRWFGDIDFLVGLFTAGARVTPFKVGDLNAYRELALTLMQV